MSSSSDSSPILSRVVRAVLPDIPALLYVSTLPPERRLVGSAPGWRRFVSDGGPAQSDTDDGSPDDGSTDDASPEDDPPDDVPSDDGSPDDGSPGADDPRAHRDVAPPEGVSTRSISDLVHPLDRERVEREIDEELATFGRYRVQYRLAPAGDASTSRVDRWVWDLGRLDSAGEKLEGLLLEITDLKIQEDRLAQRQRREVAGAFAGSVAQEFNDLLTTIFGSLDLALERIDDPDAVHDELVAAVDAVKSARVLTEQLVSFTRSQPQRPGIHSPNLLLRKMEPFILSVTGSSIRTVLSLDPAAGRARFDPALLEQAVMNLVLNSKEAMGDEGGRLVLSTGTVEFTGEDLRRGDELEPGRYATIAVSDTGPGVAVDLRGQIYEPFFSTKRGHSGLGLSASFGIVRQAGGIIRLKSAPGRGTRVTIYLPVAEAFRTRDSGRPRAIPDFELVTGVDAEGERSGTGPRLGGDARRGSVEPGSARPTRAMVVEDDPAIRRLLIRVLERAGFQVTDADRGEEGLALASDSSRRFDLVITDVMLPGIRGPELVSRLRPLQPTAKILYISGFTDDPELTKMGLRSGDSFLSKPFTIPEFLEAVQAALNRTDPGSFPDIPPRKERGERP